MSSLKDFKGGEIPTKLGKGQGGFDGIPVFKGTYSEGEACDVQVGREELVGEAEVQNAGRKG